jgi:hypothetical protein
MGKILDTKVIFMILETEAIIVDFAPIETFHLDFFPFVLIGFA